MVQQSRRKTQRKQGGKRKMRKMRGTRKSGATSWPQFVKKCYMDMKRKNPGATFKQAMKEASARKKRGEF